ncbi:MAG: galactose oxidase-like domain-containing protein, partial [Gammaproteobacteria bacterium]
PGATTHAFDMEQRLVELETQAVPGGKLRLVGPPNANIAPPGYYMLFLIDSAGVPSVARFLRVSDSTAPPPPPPPPSGNLLSNPGFESGATGWSGASGRIVTGTVRTGLKALQVKALKSGVVLVSRQLAIQPGAGYSAAVWVKTTDPYAAGALVQTQFLNSAGTPVSTVSIGTVTGTQDWRQLQRNVTVPSTAAKVRFKLVGLKEPDGVATAYFDDASLNKL